MSNPLVCELNENLNSQKKLFIKIFEQKRQFNLTGLKAASSHHPLTKLNISSLTTQIFLIEIYKKHFSWITKYLLSLLCELNFVEAAREKKVGIINHRL